MPPGIYAPAAGTPAAKLKTMKGTVMPGAAPAGKPAAGGIGIPGGVPTSPAFGGQPAPTSAVRPNPTLTTTYGGASQQTDQMGRVITSGPFQPAPFGQSGGFGGGITIEDPDQIRRARDLADYQTRADIDARTYGPRTAAPPAAPGPGVNLDELPGLLDKFKPDAVPREAPMPGLPREKGEGPEDRRAAESAAFARAAERIAGIGRGNLRALRSQMTRRGISGSGIEKSLVAENTNNTAGMLGEVVRDQAIEGLRREQDVNDRDLAAGISQRGQDLGIQSTNYTGGISQRGQDVSQADWKLNALPSILALLRLKSGAA